jgi:hypothetical protein
MVADIGWYHYLRFGEYVAGESRTSFCERQCSQMNPGANGLLPRNEVGVARARRGEVASYPQCSAVISGPGERRSRFEQTGWWWSSTPAGWWHRHAGFPTRTNASRVGGRRPEAEDRVTTFAWDASAIQ